MTSKNWLFKDTQEASATVAFSGGTLERLSEKRMDDAIDLARSDPQSRWLAFASGKLILDFSDENGPRALFETHELQAFEPDFAESNLLGFENGAAQCAAKLSVDIETLPAPFRAVDYRSLMTGGLLPRPLLSTIAQGAALLAWHSTHKFCGRCGARNDPKGGGAKRICDGCYAEHFPRTDPVVIMLTLYGDKCLLARGAHFPEGMISCLAGFVEPGESLEEAVRRETLEEAGIRTGAVVYHASQPWPFAHSLMIGFYAQALNDDIVLEPTELETGRWFTKAEVRQMMNGTHPENYRVPPRAAIASVLIRDWAEG